MSRRKEVDWSVVLFIVVIVIFFGLLTGSAIIQNSNKRTVLSYTVTDKNIKTSDDHGKYLVYTKDKNGETSVFEIEDSLWRFRWDSSDDYANIEVDKTYDFTVCGYRIHLFSMYPNILEYNETK